MNFRSPKLILEKTTFVKGTINYLKEQGSDTFNPYTIDEYEEYYINTGNIITNQIPLQQILNDLKQLRITGEEIQILRPIPNPELRFKPRFTLIQVLSQYDEKKDQLKGRQYVLK